MRTLGIKLPSTHSQRRKQKKKKEKKVNFYKSIFNTIDRIICIAIT